jgi:hypothetical protein
MSAASTLLSPLQSPQRGRNRAVLAASSHEIEALHTAERSLPAHEADFCTSIGWVKTGTAGVVIYLHGDERPIAEASIHGGVDDDIQCTVEQSSGQPPGSSSRLLGRSLHRRCWVIACYVETTAAGQGKGCSIDGMAIGVE